MFRRSGSRRPTNRRSAADARHPDRRSAAAGHARDGVTPWAARTSLGIPYDEYIKRTGADWFPALDRQIVDYPAGQVQGHTLERLFPGIGRLDDDIMPGLGLDGPSVGESVDVGAPNTINAIREGGPGTAIGLSEGAMVLNDVQARARLRSGRPAAGSVELRDVRRPGGAARLR